MLGQLTNITIKLSSTFVNYNKRNNIGNKEIEECSNHLFHSHTTSHITVVEMSIVCTTFLVVQEATVINITIHLKFQLFCDAGSYPFELFF